MDTVLIITPCTCIGLIASVLLKPNVRIKGHSLSLYWVIVLIGAASLIAFDKISLTEAVAGLTADTSINPLKILVLFISMSVLSIYLDEIGFFRYLASRATGKAGAGQRTLFLYLYLMVSVLTVFTSNDIIILTFTPFICYFAKNAGINPIPYLFAEFVAANTWSMMFVIGNPTNIYLATSAGIGFMEYAGVMFLPTMLGGIAAFIALYAVFHRSLKKPMNAGGMPVRIKNKTMLTIGLVHMAGCTVLLVVSSYVGIEMWLISLSFAVSLFLCTLLYKYIRKKKRYAEHILNKGNELERCIKRAPWELIPFVISMFVIVLALDKYGITNFIAETLGNSGTVAKYGVVSFLTANLINNIPMSVLFESVLGNADEVIRNAGVYASVIGSNIGALLTPIGALAGMMWTGMLKKYDVRVSFMTYLKYGVLIAVPTLAAALAGLAIVL